MTPDLSLLSGFARGVSLSLHVRDTSLHSGSWLLSCLYFVGKQWNISRWMLSSKACCARRMSWTSSARPARISGKRAAICTRV